MQLYKVAFLAMLVCCVMPAFAVEPFQFYIRGKEVVIRDPLTGADVDTLELEGIPGSLKISADGKRLFIRLANENSIAVHDTRTLELLDWYSLDRLVNGRRLNPKYWSLDALRDQLVFQDLQGQSILAEEAREAAQLAEASALPPATLTATSEFSLNQASGTKGMPSADFDANGNFAATWTDVSGSDGSGEGAFAREFSASGNSQTSEFQVNKARSGDQGNSTLASASNGDYVVAFRDGGGLDGDRFGVFFRRFANGGTPKDGSDVRVSNTTSGNQKEVSVDSEPDGDFVAVWTGPSGSTRAVFGRRFNANGSAKASEFVVGSSPDNVYAPDVATNSTGRFVVVWRDGTDSLVRARVYNSSGSPVTGVFKVENSSNNQFAPSVGMDENGNFTVAWQTNASGGILYRQFQPDGSPAGNTRNAGSGGTRDYAPSLSMAPGGRFCIAWRDDLLNVWARAYQANGDPLDAAFKPSQSGGNQLEANCAIDSDGNFLVSWKYRAGGGNGEIRARKFDTGAAPSLDVTCSANPEQGPAPLNVQFDANATGGNGSYSFSWNFGDGTPTDSSRSPSHTYTNTGSYEATVTVTSGSETARCNRTIQVGQAPSGVIVSELTVTSIDRGTPETILSVKGAGFVEGATVSYNDPGIDVFLTNWIDSTRIKNRINVLPSAYLGYHDVTVMNPDGSSGTGTALLRILQNGNYPPPMIASISPDTIAAGTSKDITLLGMEFANDPLALNVDAGPGLTVNHISWISPTEIRTNISADSNVTCGTRDVVAANGSATSQPCLSCLMVVSSKLALGAVIPAFLRVGEGPTAVTIRGCGFTTSSIAKIKGTTKISQVNVDSSTIILTVRVPLDATPGFKRVIVQNSDTEIVKRKDLFEIKP